MRPRDRRRETETQRKGHGEMEAERKGNTKRERKRDWRASKSYSLQAPLAAPTPHPLRE